jgi:hypothetical protein
MNRNDLVTTVDDWARFVDRLNAAGDAVSKCKAARYSLVRNTCREALETIDRGEHPVRVAAIFRHVAEDVPVLAADMHDMNLIFGWVARDTYARVHGAAAVHTTPAALPATFNS